MTRDIVTVAVAAIAMATETRGGECDSAALDLILDTVDEEDVFVFLALLRTYQAQWEQHGAGPLQRSGLMFARKACGLEP